MNLAPGTVIAERFRLVRPLGQGGMGAIWLAQHTGLDVPCALKFIHAEAAASAEIRARFEREAKAAAQLRSPHVVQILDHGVWQGLPYIAMELLEGEDLSARLKRLGRLDARETMSIASQVARALSKAHAAGLVHRDLKPANIFIARDDDREIVKVLDFGVAKVKSHNIEDAGTQTGALLGTPVYMSPEQARGTKAIDHRSDLWALGVVVYQCMTGQLPFKSTALGDLFMKIMTEPLPVPSQVAAVPPGFDAWWTRACARDPAQRFQSAKEFTDALGGTLGISAGGGIDLGLGAPALSAPSRPMQPSWPEPAALPAPERHSVSDASTIQMTPNAPGAATPVPLNTVGAGVAAMARPTAEAQKKRGAGLLAVGAFSLVTLGGIAAFFALRSPGEAQPATAPSVAVEAPEPPTPASAPAPVASTAEPIVAPAEPVASLEPMASAAPTVTPAAAAPAASSATVAAKPVVAKSVAAKPSSSAQPSPVKTVPTAQTPASKPTATSAPKTPDFGI